MSLTTFPPIGEYPPYSAPYIALSEVSDIKAALRENRDEYIALFAEIDEEGMHFRYSEGKWSLLELIQHTTDSERVFAYRAMSIARGDTGPYPGFDENQYVAGLNLAGLAKEQLILDFILSRNSLISMLTNLADEDWLKTGVASGHEVSVRALAHMSLGHCIHHIAVIKERYLSKLG